jgi:hypothetical protein
MATELDAFLASEAGDNTPTPPPAEAPPPAPTPEPEPKAPPAPEADQDDAETAERLDHNGQPYVPHQALERERQRRQDWKEKAARAEGELAALRRELDAAKRAPPPQPQQPPQPVYRAPMPDPASDPQAWAMHVMQEQTKAFVNHTLNVSERDLRREIGAEKVTEYVNEFRQLSQADPSLVDKLYSNADPYDWMRREVERQRMLRDIGDDPAQYRSKIEAEARAKWEQERQAAPAERPVSPAVGMQPSLATARSVAGRSAPQWSGEPSLDDVVSSIQNRKRANGQGPRF